ncbi:MAG: hypothetical protein IJ115_05290 [Erysipelotrichaceae bacterium]|nr:hypothetical protein [Erysipelotrichaceae bacterium]
MKRDGFWQSSAQVLKACEIGTIEGSMTVQSFLDSTYVLHKELNSQKINIIYDYLSLILRVVEINGEDLRKACSYDYSDYEDAVQTAVAERLEVDYIVTRNPRDFKNEIPVITPVELIKKLYDKG